MVCMQQEEGGVRGNDGDDGRGPRVGDGGSTSEFKFIRAGLRKEVGRRMMMRRTKWLSAGVAPEGK